MSNSTSLYSNTSSGNATVPANNNTSLYNATGVPQTINNNITVTGNISAGGYISAAGNVYGANLVTTGNVYAGNIIGNIVGNIALTGGNTEVVFNNNNSACSSPAFTFDSASNTLAITGAVTATGNVAGNYILGNGSQLTGLPATYGNSNVTTLLSAFGSNTVSTTGNISAGYFVGDGSLLTNLPPGNYSNANVAAFLPTYTGNITANAISATGNVAGLYILGDGSQLTNLPIPGVYGNTQVAAFMAAFGSNVVSTTGNVTAGYFLGDGSQLTNLPAGNYSNANVVSLLSVFGSNVVSTTGNVTAGYFLGNGSQLTGITTDYSNANVVSLMANFGSNTISTTGNITGNYILGDGSQLTNLPIQPGTYSNANVAAYLPIYTGDYAGGNMSLTGNVTASYLKTSGATGNIVGANYVSANFYLGDGGLLSNISSTYGNSNVTTLLAALGSNTISSTGNITTTANVSGGYILGNGSQLTGLPAGYSNADVNSHLAAFGSNVISTTGNITAGYFVGDGSLLTNITGANVTGTVANATFATSAGSATTATDAAQANYANIANSVSGSNVTGAVAQATVADTANAVAGGNVSGQVANALVAGTVYTNAQPNITSVGTLSALSVSGNITTGGILTDGYYYANGAPFSGGGGSTYGDANVNTLLAAWGSNTLSTTGNVSSGLLKSGAVAYTNTDGTVGQVLTTYGNGVTYFSTVSGGSGSPGGANTQLQFNNSGAFAGNSAMTFDVTSGNVTLGNIRFNNNVITNINSFQSNTNPNPGRILIGSGQLGNYSPTINSSSARLAAIDQIIKYDDGQRTTEINATLYGNLAGGNIGTSNANSRLQAISADTFLINGNSVQVNPFYLRAINSQILLGTAANTGCAFATTATATSTFVTINAGSSANTAILNMGGTTLNGNVGNMVGYYFSAGGTASVTGNTYGFYMPGSTSGIASQAMGNTARAATNYYFLRNDDDLAKAKIGMLDSFHELNANSSTTTGTVTVSKSNGQVQTIYPTGNVTIGSFTNFVTRVQAPSGTQVNTADTVTLIIQQGATPYTVTMPTGNTAIRYAGGVTTVGATANTTTMISVTGVYDYTAGANEYLVTISPEFS